MATINTTTARIGVVANAATLTITPVSTNEKAIWGPGLQGRLQSMRLRNQIRDEDELIMDVIGEFLKRAA